MKNYRIDFALTVLTGNLTRFMMMQPIVDADPSVSARWFPIRTWVPDEPFRFLPGVVRIRIRHLIDSFGLYHGEPADALVIHAFETYAIYAFLKRVRGTHTVIVNNPDGAVDPAHKGVLGWFKRNAVASTDKFVTFSNWAKDLTMQRYPWLPEDRFEVIHPGLDLSKWPRRDRVPPHEPFRLLFVGGDLMRKGADTLLDSFETYLKDNCELDLVTQAAYLPADFRARIESMPHCRLHLDLAPMSPELRRLYEEADAFVLPTRYDSSSWVALESMATGVPVITTPVGGIPDVVQHERTGLVIQPESPTALAEAVERLRLDPELRERVVNQGRRHVETNFDAHVNTMKLMALVKGLVDSRAAAARTVQVVPA